MKKGELIIAQLNPTQRRRERRVRGEMQKEDKSKAGAGVEAAGLHIAGVIPSLSLLLCVLRVLCTSALGVEALDLEEK